MDNALKAEIEKILKDLKKGKITCSECKGERLIQFEQEGKIFCPSCNGTGEIDYEISQAISQIQTWIEECIGENKIVYPWANIVNHSSQLAVENRENIGYNIAKAEIRERFKK